MENFKWHEICLVIDVTELIITVESKIEST